MKKWQIILASLLALLVMVVTPLSIMAAKNINTSENTIKPDIKGALAIVAPRVIQTGSEMSLTVFLRQDQTPVPGVAIWVISKDNIITLKDDIRALKEKGLANITDEDCQAILKANGDKIGETDGNGKLLNTFNKPGKFVLVAVKNKYIPDFSALVVRSKLARISINTPEESPSTTAKKIK